MWILIVIQAINVLQTLFSLGAVSNLPLDMLPAGVSPQLVTTVFTAASVAMFLISLAMLAGLILRWKLIFYLYVVETILVVLSGLTGLSSLSSETGASPSSSAIGAGCLIGVVVIQLVFLLAIRGDFAYDWQRITLRLDPGDRSLSALVSSGQAYAKRKMWGLAALHLLRAVAQTPDQVGNRPALALMFIQLKRYDLAERVLNEARRIRPDDPKVKDALELLASERAKG